jgi:hypothetical protein
MVMTYSPNSIEGWVGGWVGGWELVGDSDVILFFDGAFDAGGLGRGGADAGRALGGVVAVADLPAGLGWRDGWELDGPGHAVVSFGGASEFPEELRVLVPEEFRKGSGRDESTLISDWRET